MSFEALQKREQQQVIDYLAFTHLTGHRPKGMHLKNFWSTYVLIGCSFVEDHLKVNEEFLPLIERHPALKVAEELHNQGYRVFGIDDKFWKNWTIRKGIAMRDLFGRQVRIFRDGDCFQVQDENQNFAWVQLYKRGVPL